MLGEQPESVRQRAVFVDIGRGLAALLVVYTHVDMLFLRQDQGQATWLTNAIDRTIGAPLGLSDQGIGAVSVPFFFLVSGFVVTPVAMKIGARRFTANRLWRIYPPLVVAVLLSAIAFTFGLRPLTTGPVGPVTEGSLLTNLSLVNFLHAPCSAYVGVAWTLAVEVLFYLLLIALGPLLRRQTWLALAIELDLVVVVLSTHRLGTANYHAIVVNVAYLTLPILGQIVWAAWTRRIPLWAAGVFGLIGWLLFVWAAQLGIDSDYLPRPLPVGYALAFLLIGLFVEQRLVQRWWWRALSDRSYSIYLLHGAIAFPVMHLLVGTLPIAVTVLIGLVATGVAVEVSYRVVERPSHSLGQRLSRRQPGATHSHRAPRRPMLRAGGQWLVHSTLRNHR